MNSDPIGLMLKIFDDNRNVLAFAIKKAGGNPDIVLEEAADFLRVLARNHIALNATNLGDPPVTVGKP